VVIVPSMTVVAAQRLRSHGELPAKTIAIFADPVLGPDDARLDGSGIATPAGTRARGVDPPPSASTYLNRLVSTGAEARAIAALVPADERIVMTGLDASKEQVMRAPLQQYRYLHFATHGLINSRYPALSALAMSQFSSSGETVDGLLRLHDIYALDLDAELVVLSACDTALGREIRGEGLVGLTQAFMYAGARSLVVSLWQIPDRASAELMSRFYRAMLADGLTPSAALQKASLSIAAEPRWRDPYYWAAFVLVGDWVEIPSAAPAAY
jgi:CHAT domain-containing protein